MIKRKRLPESFEYCETYTIDPGALASPDDDAASVLAPEDAAARIVAEAECERQAIMDAAVRDAEAIRAEAYSEGYQAGLHELDAERAALAERASEIESEVAQEVNNFWASLEPEALKLSVEVARKILKREFEENSDFVLTTLQSALRQLRDRKDLKIRVAPQDYETVRDYKEELIASCDGIRSIEVIDDRRVDAGGCLIESNNGQLDARIDTQLNEVERTLLEAAKDGKLEDRTAA